jgi:DNA-binding LacI/PurR family transcriptional regulator
MADKLDSSAPRVRLQDVARATGVAVSTVSRVFTDPDRVSSETIDHVLDAAQRLGYRHTRGAGRGRSMGVLVQDLTNPYLAALTAAIERQARAAGYGVTLAMTEESAELERAHVRRNRPSVDGFIIAPRHLDDDQLLRLARAMPIVLFNREVEGLSSVVIDSSAGNRQIIEHLDSLGHSRVVYASGPEHSWSEQQRWAGLSEAAAASGIVLDRIGPYFPTIGQGAVAAEAALARTPTAVIAFNDQIAIGLMNRMRVLGVDVPRQVSVIGYDDTFGSDFCQPPLTTVAGPVDRAGRLAADTLLAMIDGAGGGTRQRVEGTLVLRQSTAVASA